MDNKDNHNSEKYPKGVFDNRQMPEEEDDNLLSNLDFIKFLIVARKNLVYVLLIFSLGMSIAYIFLRYTPALYQSSAVLKLDIKSNAEVLGINASNSQEEQSNSDLTGEIELIRSNLVMSKVLELLHYDVAYFSRGNILDEERYHDNPFSVKYTIANRYYFNHKFFLEFISPQEFLLSYLENGVEVVNKCRFREPIVNKNFRFVISKDPKFLYSEKNRHFYFYINSDEQVLNFIYSNLTVEVLNADANTIKVSFKDKNPAKARDIVAAIDSIYLIEGLENKFRSSELTIRFLESNLEKTENNLEKYEKQMQNFLLKNKTIDIRADFAKWIEKIEEYHNLLQEEKNKLYILESFNNKLAQSTYKDLLPIPNIEDKASASQMSALVIKFNELSSQIDALYISNKANSMAVVTKEKEWRDMRAQLIDNVFLQKKMIQEQVDQLQIQNRQLQENFLLFPIKDSEFKKLQRFYTLHEKYYTVMMDKKAEYEIIKAATVPSFRVLFQPENPSVPIYPNKAIIYLYSFLSSFLISFFFVTFKYFTHNTIDNIGELEKSVVGSILGFIPRHTNNKMKHSRLVIHESPKGSVSESLRSIRTNLEFMLPNKKSRTISVTSTISGEGKTFVSINLAGVIAYAGVKVVILDMDMRKPKIHYAFEDQNDKGISTILIGRHHWKECLKNTPIATLFYISSGPIPPNPSELIIHETFDQLLADLSKEFDMIVIDTPPVGLVTDGILIMKKVDLPIYVVRSGYSKKGFEKSINRLVVKNNFRKLSVVLNDFDNLKNYGYGYQYGYGYGYGYYHNEESSGKGLFSFIKKKFSNGDHT